MSATPAPTAAPKWAIPCWVDGHTLYFELQGQHGPCVVSFRRDELHKALATLYLKYDTEGHGEVYIRPTVVDKKLQSQGVTPADREAAALALKALLK